MKPISGIENRILEVLEHESKLPKHCYDITEDLLIHYMHAYVNILNKKSFKLDTSNYRYSRKLAGLTLVKHNIKMGADSKSIKSGFVYLIENKAFPDHYKVGMCVDLESRLSTYQTYDPYRAFAINRYEFVLDRRHYEKKILSSYGISLEGGEWIKKPNAEEIFRSTTLTYSKVYAK